MANAFQQIGAVTAMNLRNVPARWSSSLVAVLGIGGVTLVLIALLSIAAGFRVALEGSGSDDVAIVLKAGSTNELAGGFSIDTATIVADAPGIARNSKGEPIVSPELYVLVNGKRRGKQAKAGMPLRGVSQMAPLIRKHYKLEEGRMFRTGTNEVIVGVGAATQYLGLDVGKTVRWGTTDWKVVGHFSDRGGVAESEAWGDAPLIQQAWMRGPSYQSVRVKLADEQALKPFKDALTKDPRIEVDVMSERKFYVDQQEGMSKFINNVGFVLAILMGIAALVAAFNTLFSAVAGRVREIATLRAIGFGAWPVVISVLAEAMILGAVGGLLGGILAFVFLNGMTTSTLNFASFSQITFAFTVTPTLVLLGIVYGLVLCFIAGILPGIKAARQPITEGLREL